MHRYAVVVFAFSGLLAACSGGGSPPTQSSTPVPTAVPSATPTPKPTATAVPTASPTPTSPVTVDVSGSTNTEPYQIVLMTDDTATVTKDYMTNNATTQSTTVASADANQFFTDLIAANPVSNIQPGECTKSASYGTTTELTYDGFTSGDISCSTEAGNAKGMALFTDEQQIESDIRAKLGAINN